MSSERVRAALPHGPSMVLVDDFEVIEPGRTAEATKLIRPDEPCFRSAPGLAYPVSLIVESFGQAAAVLWAAGADSFVGEDEVLMFAAARDCRVQGTAHAGDVLRHRVELEQVKAGTAFASGFTRVGDRRIASFGSLIAVVRPAAT